MKHNWKVSRDLTHPCPRCKAPVGGPCKNGHRAKVYGRIHVERKCTP